MLESSKRGETECMVHLIQQRATADAIYQRRDVECAFGHEARIIGALHGLLDLRYYGGNASTVA